MDRTPTKVTHLGEQRLELANEVHLDHSRVRKPPPITPRRFNKFFTPRPRNTLNAVRTSRNALRTISSSALNTRRAARPGRQTVELLPTNESVISRKRRRIDSLPTTPTSAAPDLYLPSSQEALQSSPTKCDQDLEPVQGLKPVSEVGEDLTDVEIQPEAKIVPYYSRSSSRNLLCTRLTGRRQKQSQRNVWWQAETVNFYSSDHDINSDFTHGSTPCLPFSLGSCHTNPIVAIGDEEGWIRLIDTGNATAGEDSIKKTVLAMRPHDNALMDLDFSSDDFYIATASGDQTCQIIDVHTQQSLYTLRSHTSSVKRIEFQPGSGNRILASCGRDGQICFWDLRTTSGISAQDRQKDAHVMPMARGAQPVAPVSVINDAHTAGSKYKSNANQAKPNKVPGRADFSITSLSFLGGSRSNLVATASEVDTVIKIWDMRKSHTYSARSRNRLPTPISSTPEPISHEFHRRFGVNSIALSSDASRLYALSRDHTVYAYSTAHLILGSSYASSQTKPYPSRTTESSASLGPIYGFRHAALRISTFWPKLAIRQATDTSNELLAVGSTDDCAVLFPTNERYLTASTKQTNARHGPESTFASTQTSRPQLRRAASSSFNVFEQQQQQHDDSIPIYYNGTPLAHGHNKEVTSLAWSSEGNLVTASDDCTVRCWRENSREARLMRMEGGKDAVLSWKKGWADVGLQGYDDTE